MGHHDRHGRLARADNDLRRRPTDGFRVAGADRFLALVHRAVAALPEDMRRHVQHAVITVQDVPDPDGGDVDLDGELVLARLVLPGPGGVEGRLRILRRPLELRAQRRDELQADVALTVRHAVQDALGQPRDEP